MAEREYRAGKQILKESDIIKDIVVDDLNFKIRIPSPAMQEQIERAIAFRLGCDLTSYPQNQYNILRRNVTLDILIEDSPDEWNGCGECYDEDLLNNIWDEYLKLKEEFRRSVQQGRFRKGR